jgi:RNA polymerase sigma factor (sigma-70 family)
MPTRKQFLDFLFHLHGKELLAFAQQRSGNEVAEDLVQEAYARLLQHPDPASITNPRAYLYKVIANLGINLAKHDGVRARHDNDEKVDLETLASPLPGLETVIDNKLHLEMFLSVLEELPEPCQYAFILNKLDGLSYTEVAKSLGISTKTAQRYILKAWQHCLNRLGKDIIDGRLS